jgi:outer membrane protein TolC
MAASKEAVDLARKTMAAEQRKYELGQGQIFLVLEAQTELAAAEQGRLQAEISYQLAVAHSIMLLAFRRNCAASKSGD